MEESYSNVLIASIIVMFLVIIFDQYIAPWPVDAFNLGNIILYPIYLIFYGLAYLIGAAFFYYLNIRFNMELDFYSWVDFTIFSLLLTMPTLAGAVSLSPGITMISVVLTVFISLIIVFLPLGLFLGFLSSRTTSSINHESEKLTKIKNTCMRAIKGLVGAVVGEFIVVYILQLFS